MSSIGRFIRVSCVREYALPCLEVPGAETELGLAGAKGLLLRSPRVAASISSNSSRRILFLSLIRCEYKLEEVGLFVCK